MSAACPPAAPLRAASPAVSHARCVISHFIGRGGKIKKIKNKNEAELLSGFKWKSRSRDSRLIVLGT